MTNVTAATQVSAIDNCVFVQDENDDISVLVFASEEDKCFFESILGDAGYGRACGGYEVDEWDRKTVELTEAYAKWRKAPVAVSREYLAWVSEQDAPADLLNMETLSAAYLELTDKDVELLTN